ncbi:MAG: hypothetical protein KDD52_02515 [Bdellovibrionales bacterium]|nr:hypothetical protein [Bdellovibrionales bacterium]
MKFVCTRCSSIIEIKNQYLPEERSHIQCPKCDEIFLYQPEDESVHPIDQNIDPFDLISKSTLINQGPIRSQPEELLFRPDNHSQYDFELMQETLALPSKLKKKPWLGSEVSPLRRIVQSLLTLSVIFSGLVFGLRLLGVEPKPQNLALLFEHGYFGPTQSIQILQYQGKTTQYLDREEGFYLQGVIKNFGKNLETDSLSCSLSYFDSSGKLLDRKDFTCCSKTLQEGEVYRFERELKKPEKFSSYQLRLLLPALKQNPDKV